MQGVLFDTPMKNDTIKQLLISTNELCLICFKECSTNCVEEGQALCRILTRYFGVNLMVPELVLELQRNGVALPLTSNKDGFSSERVHLPICQDCSILANKLSQLFQQLEVTQMKLQALGQNLCDIMTSAEKVSSRVSRFHKRLSWPGEKPKGMVIMIAESIRKEVLKKCAQPRSSSSLRVALPTMKVTLERNTFVKHAMPVHEIATLHATRLLPGSDFMNSEDNYLAFLGCTVSLWIVFLLALLDVDMLVETMTFRNNVARESDASSAVDLPPQANADTCESATQTSCENDEMSTIIIIENRDDCEIIPNVVVPPPQETDNDQSESEVIAYVEDTTLAVDIPKVSLPFPSEEMVNQSESEIASDGQDVTQGIITESGREGEEDVPSIVAQQLLEIISQVETETQTPVDKEVNETPTITVGSCSDDELATPDIVPPSGDVVSKSKSEIMASDAIPTNTVKIGQGEIAPTIFFPPPLHGPINQNQSDIISDAHDVLSTITTESGRESQHDELKNCESDIQIHVDEDTEETPAITGESCSDREVATLDVVPQSGEMVNQSESQIMVAVDQYAIPTIAAEFGQLEITPTILASLQPLQGLVSQKESESEMTFNNQDEAPKITTERGTESEKDTPNIADPQSLEMINQCEAEIQMPDNETPTITITPRNSSVGEMGALNFATPLSQSKVSQSESEALFPKHKMVLRKRKSCQDNESRMNDANKKPLLIGAPTLDNIHVAGDSGDEISEEDIVREELLAASLGVPKRMRTRGRGRSPKRGKYTPNELQLYALITPEQATNAVKAIKVPTHVKKNMKTLQVQEEAEVNLSGVKEETQCFLEQDATNAAAVSQNSPPGITNMVDSPKIVKRSKHSSFSTFLIVPATEESALAKVEKDRTVNGKLKNCVKCPCCFQMFSSYFHLEFHRKNVPKCRIDDYAKQIEMMDIEPPVLPPAKENTGSNLCSLEDCCKVFDDIKTLNTRVKVNESFQCRFGCLQMFAKGSELAAHEIRNHQYGLRPPNFFKCPRCDFITEHEDGYLQHFLYKHLNVSTFVDECVVCQRGFRTMEGSRTHFYMYHNVAGIDEKNIFRCDLCSGAFLKQEQLLEHRRIHFHIPQSNIFALHST